MSMKLLASVVASAEVGEVNVSELCAAEGVSRKTFYKWRARYLEVK